MQAKMKIARMNIEGMHCGSCAIDIKETLEEHVGVERAEVNYDNKNAVVEFDEQTIQTPAIIKTIKDLGYEASVINQ